MPKIKLANPGMDTFNGYMGTVRFENGVSVEEPSKHEINRLAALTRVEVIEEDGSSKQTGIGVAMAGSRGDAAPVLTPLKRGDAEEYQVEKNAPDVEIKAPEAPVDEHAELEAEIEGLAGDDAPAEQTEANEPEPVYSRDQLEEIADADGIAGLRKVADPLGVKNNSIQGLIKEILNAQGKA